nr:PAS domain S-box protein [Natranaeroarchaeum aerophilus]
MTFLRGQVESLTGYSVEAFEAHELTWGELVREDTSTNLTEDIETAIEERSQFSVTYDIRTSSGEIKHVFERGLPIVEDGDVVALEGVIVEITQRKEYEQRLRRQNDLFAQTQEMADVGGWELDPRTETLRWTDQVHRIHGLPLDYEPTVEDALEFYHEDDRPLMQEAVQRAIVQGESFDHELRIITYHGEQRWVRARGVPQVEDGETVRVRGAIQDVTDRRERERSLREEKALTKSIFEALPDILYVLNEEGQFTRWNDRFRSVTGYSDDEIAEMRPEDFIAKEDRDAVRAKIRSVLEDEDPTTVKAQLKTKSGEQILYEFTSAPLSKGDRGERELVGLGRDISGRLEQQRRFEAVFNNTYQFTGLLDSGGTLIEVNDAGLEFTNTSRGEVIGVKLWEALELCTDDAQRSLRRGFEQALSGDWYRDELRVRAEGQDTIIDVSIRPITDESGEVVFLVPEGRDITEFKEREQLLRVLNRLLRHNIRNDLTAIRGYAGTLADSVSDPELIEYAGQIDAAADNLLSTSEKAKEMVDLILAPVRDTATLDVEPVVKTVSRSLRREYPAATVTVAIEESVVAECDERLGIVLEQLIENGIEHTTGDQPHVDVRVSGRGDTARIEIADTGPGIPEDEWSMINEEVRDAPTQLRHGKGIGLILTQWIVDEFGGSVQYTERPETGSLVIVRLPAASAAEQND